MDINTASEVLARTASTITMSETLEARRTLVATTCCVCAAELADATSVELGIGPTCRRKHAKADREAAITPDWDGVTDALGDFAALDKSEDRIKLFETAMAQIALARTGADHKLANLITHYIAATQERTESIGGLILALERMGRPNLAAALRRQQYTVRVELDGEMLNVFTPFTGALQNAMWSLQLGRWSRALKCYQVPRSRRVDLRRVLGDCYPGVRAIGPAGEFVA